MKSQQVLSEQPVRFIGRLSTMGKKKVIIYVPERYHAQVLKKFKDKDLKITIEDAI
jgi:hypothetical protein